MDQDKLISDLQRDEGWRSYLYDDANGRPIVSGYTVHGHPTIGFGFALDVSPLTQAEAMPILESRSANMWQSLRVAEPWVDNLPEPVQRALGNMVYNMGITTLLKFNTFLGMLRQGNYAGAADDLSTTAWFGQVGARAARIQDLIRSGSGDGDRP